MRIGNTLAVYTIRVSLLLMFMMFGLGTSWAAAQSMPEFLLSGVGHSPEIVSGTDLKGKVVLVNFWATWCPPCRREIPSLIRLQDENRAKGFVVIGISMDKSDPDKVAKFVEKIGVNYAIAIGNNEVARGFGALGAIPSSFLVDSNGLIVKKYLGYTTYEKMAKDVEELLN